MSLCSFFLPQILGRIEQTPNRGDSFVSSSPLFSLRGTGPFPVPAPLRYRQIPFSVGNPTISTGSPVLTSVPAEKVTQNGDPQSEHV